MKKRLTAWLLVFCMALSLLPGTAFAAEGGGDGTVTITYDLNDGISDYQLQLKTTAGHEPANQPSAKWAGRPFLTWTSDKAGQVKADYSKDTTLYAQWQSGYKVTIDLNPTSEAGFPTAPHSGIYTTENNGKLSAEDVADLNKLIKDFEELGQYTLEGWYTEYDPATKTFSKPFGDISGTITKNDTKLYAKWMPIYHITFIYHNIPVGGSTPETDDAHVVTTTGGVLKELPKEPTYSDDPYTFEGWYIEETVPGKFRDAVDIPDGSTLKALFNGHRGVKVTGNLSAFSFTKVAEDLKANDSAFTGEIKVHANWAAPYGIIFDANGGHFGNDEKNTKTIIKTSGSNNTVNPWPADPTREGDKYKFIEWRLAKDTDQIQNGFTPTGDVVEAGRQFKEPVHVYAVWQKRIHVKIDYDIDDKSVNVDKYLDEPGKIGGLGDLLDHAKTLSRPGYIFDTWSKSVATTDTDGKPTTTTTTGILPNALAQETFSSDTVLKPEWKPGAYITFDANGGEFDGTVTNPYTTDVQYRLESSKAPSVKYDGYEFSGWYTAPTGGTKITPAPAADGKTYYVFPDTIDTVYAHWGPRYDITLNPNGGTMTINGTDFTTQQIIKSTADGKYSTFPPTNKTGMKLLGWFVVDENGTATETEAKVGGTLSGPVKLIAKWGDFTITFHGNGGTTSLTTVQTKDGKVSQPTEIPVWLGYTFAGWYTEANGGNPIDWAQVFEEDTDVYAHWTAGATTTSVTPSKVPNRLPAVSKPAAADGAPMVTADTAPYTITFNYNDNATAPVVKQTDGDGKLATSNWPAPTRTGYQFAGWFTAVTGGTKIEDADKETPFNKDTTLYAHWEPVITFNQNENGDGNSTNTETHATTNGKLASLPTPNSRAGFKFIAWYRTPSGTGDAISTDTTFTEPVILYAHWEPKVTFDANGGVMLDDNNQQVTTIERVTTNKTLSTDKWPTPSLDGSTFMGWYTEKDSGDKVEPNAAYPFAGGDKLYAHWSRVEYTIIFDRNDDTGSTMKRTTTNGKVAETDMPRTPSRDGYTFTGWYTEKEGGNRVTSNYPFSADTTVYAHWTLDIVVTFDANGGAFADGKTAVEGKADDQGKLIFPEDPIYGGHVILEWYDAPKNGNEYTASDTFNKDTPTRLYAHWEEQEYTIKWEIDVTDATLKSIPDTTTVGGKIPKMPELTRPGYLFAGWKVTAVDDSAGRPAVGALVTENTIFSTNATLTTQWEELPAPPDRPTGSKEITFIVDVPTALPDAAHFVLYTSNDRLQHLPTLVGRDADGWRRQNAATAVTTGEVYNGDTDLYINIAQTILITFDWNNAKDGGTSSTTTVRTNKDGTIPEDKWPDKLAPDKNPGYQFAGWYDKADDSGVPVSKLKAFTEPTTIYAHWKGPFTITFDANGGEFPDGTTTKGVETDDDGNLDPLEVAEKVPTPTREGYTKFGGWSLTKDGTEAVEPDAQPYTGAATLYAIWGPPYAIEYDAMGGEVTPTEEQKLSTEDGKFPELPVPTHPRDSFGGWYTTKDYQEGTLVSAGGDCPGAVTLYAKWTREPPYAITFEANNADATMEDPASGQPVATITLKTDDKGVLMQAPPEPTLRGGKFQGWYTKAEEGAGELISDAATRTYTDDMTLYAHWETREFTITFDFNLGAIMSNPLTITTFTTTKGKSLTFLPDTLPQAASGNYKIKGWYRVQNPVEGKDQPVTTSSTFDRDTTLYAQWELAADLPITFKYPNVTFLDAENGNALVTLEVDKDYKMSSVPPGPYKEGQTFSGWFYREPDRPDGEEKQFTKDTEVTGSLRVYPKYVGAGFTITFEPGEESELEPIKVKTTSEGRIPDGEMPSPTWEGHTFTGWFTAAEGGTKINRRTVFTQDTTVYAHWDKDDSSEPGGPDDPGEDKPGPTSPPYTITFNPNGGNLNASTTALTDLNGRLMSLPTPARTGYSFDGWFNGSERITTATVFTANTTIMAQWSTGSGGSGGNGSGDINGYAITVSNTSGGRVSVSTTYAREGDRVTVTVRPYSGYQLDRIEVTNARGYDVDLRDQGSNRYVFYMPASRVTVDAVFMELIANNGNGGNTGNTGSTGGNTGGNTNWNPGGTVTQPSGGASSGMGIFSQPVLNTVPMPYLDVHPSDWYYSSVDYMWQRQLMGGVSNNRFGPQATTSNAMVWTILARLAGVDVTSGASVWYENARSWAVSNRISDGVGPNSAVTREQLATMLWNFKGSPAVGYDLGQFGDRGQISTYQAECALSWAVANNIVTGTANRLNPRGTATRAEVAAMITRFCQNT